MQYGKNVRAPQLVAGTDYAMRVWSKTPEYVAARFLGFGTEEGVIEGQGNKMLKCMTPADRMHFMVGETLVKARQVDMCLVNEAGVRITFAETLAVAVAVVETPVVQPEPLVTEGAPSDAADAMEKAVLTLQEQADALGITKDALRKRLARAAAKAAKEAVAA